MALDKLQKAEQLLKALQGYGAVSEGQLTAFVQEIANLFAQYRSATSSLNKETKENLNLILKNVNEEHKRILDDVKKENTANSKKFLSQFEKAMSEAEFLLQEIRDIEIPKGEKGEDGLAGKDGSPDTGEEIVKKINSQEEKIDASKIKNLPTPVNHFHGEGGSLVETPIVTSTGSKLPKNAQGAWVLPASSSSSITLTTNGTSGAATLVGDTLNIPIYSAGSGGISRTVTVTSGDFAMGSTASTDYDYYVSGLHNGTIPTAVGNKNHYYVRNNHTASITLTTTGVEVINQQNSGGAIVTSTVITLESGRSYTLGSDGTSWNII